MTLKKPSAPKRPHPITQHGQTRIDDFFWLRYRDDPDVMKYIQAESDYLHESMRDTLPLQKELFNEMKDRIQETDSTVPEKRGGYYYYERTEAGKQYPIFCRKKNLEDSPEEVLLDQNQLAEGNPFCSVSAFSVSPDGNKLAYSVDIDGREVYTVHIKDLITGKHLPETIPNTYGSVYVMFGVEWSNDGSGFYYTTLDYALRPYSVYFHKLGDDPADDRLIFQEDDETFFLSFFKTRDQKYIILEITSTMTSEMHFLRADHPEDAVKIIAPRERGVEYYTRHHNGYFYFLTNENAKNFKLTRAPVENPGRESWVDVIPHRAGIYLTDMDSYKNHFVLCEYRDGLPQIRIVNPENFEESRYVKFPDPTYYFDLEDNPEFDTEYIRISYSSLVTPTTIVDIHMDTGRWDIQKEERINGFDKSKYACEFIHATTDDGKKIPISLTYRKDLKQKNGNPTLMQGYGAYGSNLEVMFLPHRISLLDRGFVFAMAHIRGSSVLGREWYEDGRILKKKNSFTDFITCGEYLIENGITEKNKLAIMGVSAGGLLVSASMVIRPDLFKSVIAKVPFVDVINSMSDPSIPLTSHEYDEWGNPSIKEQFEYMLSYSPYDNLKTEEYPNLLLTAGFNDPRVMYWEPAKFAAKLRSFGESKNLLLLKTNFEAGHAGGSGRYQYMRDAALEYAFLIKTMLI